jgi:peptidoglycan hydrolase FlgJ
MGEPFGVRRSGFGVFGALAKSMPGETPSADRAQSREADRERLVRACQEFESVFLQEMIKGLRRTVPETRSRAETLYRSMLDEEVAKVCARRGMGLGDLLIRKLESPRDKGEPGATSQELKISGGRPISVSGQADGQEGAEAGGSTVETEGEA